jgi:putative component of membrane protein insertase Oxa1/YidC/SpoIIIJ protein YidD
MTAAIPISASPLACRLIELYQRRLSPLKGFRCAYRAVKGRASCSEFARRAIARLGVLTGVQLLRRRFDKCHRAAKVLEYETRRAKKKGRWKDRCWSAANSGPGCDGRSSADACDVVSLGCSLWP